MIESRRILILGGGVMQLPAIRASHRLGLTVVVADGNPEAPGRAEADEFIHVDLRDTLRMFEAAVSLQTRGRLDAVFTAGTDFSSTVAYVSEKLHLPGIRYETALNATDKFRMRSVLSAAGVGVPAFTVLSKEDLSLPNTQRALENVGLPCVVKPVDSMGARGVVRADDAPAALEFAKSAVTHSRSERVVIEGYIDGPEFSLDALVYGESIQVTGFADRHIEFPPYFIEMGHTIPTALPEPQLTAVIDEFKRGIRALGITSGAAKGDIKLSSEGPVVGEIAARLSGGYMSGWTYPLSSGVELTEQAVRIALGEPPGSLSPVWDRISAERAVISIPGVIDSIEDVPDPEAKSDVAFVFMSRRPGDRVRLPTSNVEKCGNIIAVADSRAGACNAAQGAVAGIEVILRPNDRETNEFLFRGVGDSWAFNPKGLTEEWLERLKPTLQPLSPEPQKWAGAISIGPIPDVPGVDWQWRTLSESIYRLASDGLVTMNAPPSPGVNAFWRSVMRGGLQGARYALRTVYGAQRA